MYHGTEAERLLELCTESSEIELRAIGHALLAVADAIRAAAPPSRYRPEDDEPIPFRLAEGSA
jgi:hypothetical protein